MENRRTRPDWIKVRLNINNNYKQVRKNLEGLELHTVCEEARCPNRHECWNRGTATIMILGDVCTRSCRFCAVKTGRPEAYDRLEPFRVAESVRQMKLKHVVITSVDRDELPDLGAEVWAATIREVRKLNPETAIEVLTPDFKGNMQLLKMVLDAKPDVYSHNMETVESLHRRIRPQAKYDRSLAVLKFASDYGALTKSGIMVGLGETSEEIESLMKDVVSAGVQLFTIGQYLQPTPNHHPVMRYISPREFVEYRKMGLALGLKHVVAGALVRSSYHADEQLNEMHLREAALGATHEY